MGEKQLGGRILALRKSLGLTQEALAAKAGLALRNYQRIEYDQVSPLMSTIENITKALGCTVADLYKEPTAIEKDSASLRKAFAMLIALDEAELQRAITILESLSRNKAATVKNKKNVG